MPIKRTKSTRKTRNTKKRGNKNYRRNTRRYKKVKRGGYPGEYDDSSTQGANTYDEQRPTDKEQSKFLHQVGKTFIHNGEKYTVDSYDDTDYSYYLTNTTTGKKLSNVSQDEVYKLINQK